MFISYKQKKKQKGYALILSIFVATFFLTLTALTSQYTLGALKSTRTEFQKLAQARNVAEAGLQDTAFWFERQTSFKAPTSSTLTTSIWCDGGTFISAACIDGVSVTIPAGIPDKNRNHLAFRPQVAISTFERGDTDDPRGIIRDIPIDPANDLYGHYEVLRYDPSKWKSDILDDNATNTVMDISDEKLVNITSTTNVLGATVYTNSVDTGRYWRVVSTGTLYERKASQMDKDNRGVYTEPYTNCKILGRYSLSENMLKLNYSGEHAAVLLNDCSKFTKFTNATITANAVSTDKSIVCDGTAGGLTISTLTGISGAVTTSASKFNTESVFGLSSQELKGIANQRETSIASLKRDASGRFGNSEIIYLDATTSNTTFTFDQSNPLKGGGILYINNGDLVLDANAGSLYTGIIYLKNGSITIKELNSITGSLFLENGSISVDGGGEKVDIGYSSKVMSNLINALSVFKEDSLSYKSISVK